MTFNTDPHAPDFTRQTLQIADLPVALLAGNLAIDVPLVIEHHVFGHVIDFYPRGGGLRVKIPMLLQDLRVLGNNILMTVQAFFHRRYSGKIRVSHIRVTELTLDLLDAVVHIVAEGDRLLGSDIGFGRKIKEINEGRYKKNSRAGYPNRYAVVSQSSDSPKNTLQINFRARVFCPRHLPASLN
jgi:hypothetical protein